MISTELTRPRFDEALYSALTRLSVYMGSPAMRVMHDALFGLIDFHVADDMPNGLTAIVASGRLSSAGLDEAVHQWTAFPYYAAFAPPSRVRAGAVAIATTGRWPHEALGSWTLLAPAPDRLRFCLSCRTDMLEQHGDAWWRRAHQLPSVLVCPDHGEVLRETAVNRDVRKRRLVAADAAVCPLDAPAVVVTDKTFVLARVRRLARSSDAILDQRPGGHPDDRRETYLQQLNELGMLDRTGEANLAAIAAAMLSRWGMVLVLWPGLMDRNGCAQGWIGTLLMGEHRSPPLHHLLLNGMTASAGNRGLAATNEDF